MQRRGLYVNTRKSSVHIPYLDLKFNLLETYFKCKHLVKEEAPYLPIVLPYFMEEVIFYV